MAAEEEEVEVVEEEEEGDKDISDSDVCTKYREAGKIADLALQGVLTQCVEGATVINVCKFGDEVIAQRCSTIYRGKKNGVAIEKGVAFPTCISLNECVCHNSPLESESSQTLAAGDVVKIDLGVHIDGYITVVAHTMQVAAAPTPEAPLDGPFGNIMHAAHICSEVCTKLIRPGNTNQMVSTALKQVAETFGVNLVQGCLSHQMKRYVIDGNKVVILREELEQKVDDQTFELNEVYAVDVALSTGEGKPRESEARTTVFKRAVDKSYRLKMRSSRTLFNEINQKFPTLPFTLRAFDDERQARMGVVECMKHELVHPYPALYERPGDVVVHFKFTLLLLPSGSIRITGVAIDPASYTTEATLPEEVQTILSLSSKKKKKRSKKKKAGSGGGEAGGE